MLLYLLTAKIIAQMPIALIPIMKTIIAQSSVDSSDINRAAREQTLIFVLYVGSLLLAAFLTVALWKSGNKYQGAIKADAESRIEKVRSDAATESKRIETDSTERIKTVESNASVEIGKARSKAEEAIRAQEELRKQSLEIQERLTEANAKLEKERKTSRELEKSLHPRDIEIIMGPGATTNFDELKRFAGIKVEMEVLTDAEAIRSASRLAALLQFANWNMVSIKPNPDLWAHDGV